MFSLSRRSFQASLSALLFALALSSCVGVRDARNGGLAPFTSDGCTLFPDGTFKDRDKWCDCCETHDLAYWQGGSADERDQADKSLRDCMLKRTGDRYLSETMYLGARVGGHAAFPTWYRWGYGWPYGRGYQPLSGMERADAQKQRAQHARRHPDGYCAETDN